MLELGARTGDGVAIGGADAVVFDFSPQVDIGAEILSRRGEDSRLMEERPAVARRREKDRQYHEEEFADADAVDERPRSSSQIASPGPDD